MPVQDAMAEALMPANDARSAAPSSSPARSRSDGLTRREQEVLALLARGLTNREIAAHLTISERTAETHVSRILGKLGLTRRAQLTAWAIQHHL
jgi:non-specific serine/threonine protein kinase